MNIPVEKLNFDEKQRNLKSYEQNAMVFLQKIKGHSVVLPLIAKFQITDAELLSRTNWLVLQTFLEEFKICADPKQTTCKIGLVNLSVGVNPETRYFFLKTVPCAHALYQKSLAINNYDLLVYGTHEEEKLLTTLHPQKNGFYLTSFRNMMIKQFANLATRDFKNKKKGFFLYGPTRIGKTFLLFSLANLWVQKHKVCFVNANYLIQKMKHNLGQQVHYLNQKWISKMAECEILVIDDLGAEKISSWVRDEVWYNIINNRLHSQTKLTFITSNFSWRELLAMYQNVKDGLSLKIEKVKSERFIARLQEILKYYLYK